MGTSKVKLWFDEETDILYVSFGKGPTVDSEEREEGIRLEYNKEGEVVGIEITEITKRLVKPIARELNEALR